MSTEQEKTVADDAMRSLVRKQNSYKQQLLGMLRLQTQVRWQSKQADDDGESECPMSKISLSLTLKRPSDPKTRVAESFLSSEYGMRNSDMLSYQKKALPKK